MVATSLGATAGFMIGGWVGYYFGDIFNLQQYKFWTKDRVILLYGEIGAIGFLAPSYLKKKASLMDVISFPGQFILLSLISPPVFKFI